jgi:asparagine synthase (glutamine-hydrolysing)
MFNGEIFNYDKDIYGSDIEYLCSIFSMYKGGSFQMFCAMFLPRIQTWDGFWSIVVYDTNNKEVIAFTDPLGKKCLYYNNDGEISSEIKSLYHSQSTIDQHYISTVRKCGYVTNDSTPFEDVKRFLPNNIYHYTLDNPDFKTTYPKYYKGFDHPIEELKGCSYEDHLEWLWNKMFESVQNRLVSKNYPISLLVSGGLDSSIIAAILAQLKADVRWFSIENGEKEYIDILSKHLDKGVTFLDYSMDDSLLKEIYQIWNEGPIDLGSVIPQFHLFEAVKKFGGYRIVLSGDGADEIFGGYSRINEYDSQKSDTFDELSFYHLPRLDKMSMAHTLELRSPFLNLDIVRFALHLPLDWRKGKQILKDTFSPLLPPEVVNRKKEALKNPKIKEDKLAYRQHAVDLFLDL